MGNRKPLLLLMMLSFCLLYGIGQIAYLAYNSHNTWRIWFKFDMGMYYALLNTPIFGDAAFIVPPFIGFKVKFTIWLYNSYNNSHFVQVWHRGVLWVIEDSYCFWWCYPHCSVFYRVEGQIAYLAYNSHNTWRILFKLIWRYTTVVLVVLLRQHCPQVSDDISLEPKCRLFRLGLTGHIVYTWIGAGSDVAG